MKNNLFPNFKVENIGFDRDRRNSRVKVALS